MGKRDQNEKKYGHWKELAGDNRQYWLDVKGRYGWLARYVKVVNSSENTLRFYQEIYNEKGQLVEIHEKFPVDKGHQKVSL